jgi:hypothetical protein
MPRGLPGGLRWFAPVLVLVSALPVVGIRSAFAAGGVPAPSISVTNTWVKEGNATVNASFQVSLSNAPASGTVSVKVATANMSALAGSDYTAVASTTLTWGTTSPLTKTVTVPVLGDTVKEGTETFALNLSAPVNGVLSDAQGIGYIADDEAPFFIYARDVGVTEGNSGTKTMSFTLSLSVAPPSGQSVTVKVATANGTATAPGDYTAVALTTKTFAAGVSSLAVAVPITGDTTVEPNETLRLNLSAPSTNAVIADTQATGTIINDDGTPGATPPRSVYVTNVAVVEGNTGTKTASFAVSLSSAPATGQTVKVNVATANGTATAPSDYTAVPTTTLTYTAGQFTQPVAVTVVGDVLKEPNEAFSLVLSAPVNAALGDGAGAATIVDEEGPFFAYARDASIAEGNAGTTNLAFTLALSAAPAAGQSASVSVATANGTASAPSDYTALPLTVKSFGPGVSSMAVNVVINGDTTIEADETLLLNVSVPSANVIIGDAQGKGTLLDDDAPPAPTVGPETAVSDPTYGSQPGNQGDTAVAWNGTENLVAYADSPDDMSGVQHIYGSRVAADGTVLDIRSFLISNTAFSQSQPAVTWDGTNFLVVWSEYHPGAQTTGVYGARVNSAGTVLDPTSFKIHFLGSNSTDVAIASNGTDSLVTWRNQAANTIFEDDIYGARVSSAGTVLDTTAFAISAAAHDQYEPAVAWNGTNYFVVWGDNRAATSVSNCSCDIYGTQVGSDGTVADVGGIAISTAADWQQEPVITSNGSDFFVAWDDHRSGGSWDVYGTLIDAAGTVLSPTGTVISNAGQPLPVPAVAWNGTNYAVVWEDPRSSGYGDIYTTRVSAAGAVLDPSGVLVSNATYDQQGPALAATGTDFFAVWTDGRTLNSDVYGSRITGAGVVSDPSGIRITSALDRQGNSAIAWDGTNFLVVWNDLRSGTLYDIYAARIAPDGTVLDPDGIPVSTDVSSDQITPAVAWDGTNFLVVWEDSRNYNGNNYNERNDIYGARVGADGTVVDPGGMPISTADKDQTNPKVAWNGQNYLVTYNLNVNIQGAFISAAGEISANDFEIATSAVGGSAVASNGTDFLVAWTSTAQADQDIYGATVTATGTVHAPVPISTAAGVQAGPSAVWNGTNYLVAWTDNRSGAGGDVYGTLINGAGQLIGSAATGIPISTAANNQGAIATADPSTAIATAADGSGFIVLWNDERSGAGKFDVYGARLTANGTVEDPTGFPVASSATAEGGPAITEGASGTHLVTYNRFSTEAPFNGVDRVWSRTISPN